jgi:RimJ/RimL family protein N-acetyltransferase
VRLRTPSLELRLGSEDELRALGEIAARGVHPAEQMPFSVAWTDRSAEPSFLEDFCAYHRERLATWSTDEWHLNLLVWESDELVGTQELLSERFAETREVGTGSWLGLPFQGRGIGTEMRAAVLELAFRGLGAATAVSAWLDGNDSSRRVSEKLGYIPAGTGVESPRGEPLTAHTVRLERERWRSPVAVEIDGLEGCLSLFGADRPAGR